MIGWYVHHQGRGHLHRAQTVAALLHERTGEDVTGLSTLPRPADWPGDWVQLPPDDTATAAAGGHPRDTTAGDTLHWVPLGDPAIASRAATLSAWVATASPALVVVDVSVEVATLVRLHGVPVLSVVLPGDRTDPAHLLGLRLSTAVLACWPEGLPDMLPGLPTDVRALVRPVGAVSRVPVLPRPPRRPGPPRVALLQGRGGGALTHLSGPALHRLAPDWEWTELGGGGGWVEDPTAVLRDADVVVAGAGQNSLAEVAACRVPAVVVPAARPHEEQATTAAVLAREGFPAVVVDHLPDDDWTGLLERARGLDGTGWARWCDGDGADRFAAAVLGVARVAALA